MMQIISLTYVKLKNQDICLREFSCINFVNEVVCISYRSKGISFTSLKTTLVQRKPTNTVICSTCKHDNTYVLIITLLVTDEYFPLNIKCTAMSNDIL